jgi:hypothetical protein
MLMGAYHEKGSVICKGRHAVVKGMRYFLRHPSGLFMDRTKLYQRLRCKRCAWTVRVLVRDYTKDPMEGNPDNRRD